MTLTPDEKIQLGIESAYSGALEGFAYVFDKDIYVWEGTEGEIAEMKQDVKVEFAALQMWALDNFPYVEAYELFEAIRDAGSDLGIPSEWMEL